MNKMSQRMPATALVHLLRAEILLQVEQRAPSGPTVLADRIESSGTTS